MKDVSLDPGETITRSVRKHWFVLLLNLIPFALLAWLPTTFMPFIHFVASAVPHTGTASIPAAAAPFVELAYGLWLLIVWCAAFNTFTRYWLNEWVITNTRIIEIHQFGFFSREISSLLLVRIQDVDTDVDGLFGTLLGYGQLQVQSAGRQEHFIMDDIANPEALRDLIMHEIAALHADGLSPASITAAAQSGV